ncbi:MAG TPA: glycosyl hydrolase [Solirubrobacteraceae bacterium]|nr:glycosyl hydrolase [Solirubrobacteraceae bacterium]
MAKRVLGPAVWFTFALCATVGLSQSFAANTDQAAHSSSTTLIGGVNIGSVQSGSIASQADRSIALAHQLHAKVVRMEVPWSVMEPLGPNQIDSRALAYTDRLAADAASAGIRLIMLVQSTPCWASSAPAALLRSCVQGQVSKANSWGPTDPEAFAAFVAYLAQRYGPQLTAIEIWNEPDQSNEAYFAGPNKAVRYAAMLRAAYPAIKRANPNVLVLGGSLVGSNGAFLRALYAAGIRGFYDGLAVHFYNLTLASLRSIHETQLANGDATPLWLDEFGWTSCWPRRKIQQEQGCVTAQTQAVNILDTFHALSRVHYVAAAVLYKLLDSGNEEFGVVSVAGKHKRSFAAFQRVLASPFGSVSRTTVGLSAKGGRVRASGAGPVGDFMELEALQGSVLRYRALFTLDRFDRYSIALPAVLGTQGLRVRVFQYGSGPSRAAQSSI